MGKLLGVLLFLIAFRRDWLLNILSWDLHGLFCWLLDTLCLNEFLFINAFDGVCLNLMDLRCHLLQHGVELFRGRLINDF